MRKKNSLFFVERLQKFLLLFLGFNPKLLVRTIYLFNFCGLKMYNIGTIEQESNNNNNKGLKR